LLAVFADAAARPFLKDDLFVSIYLESPSSFKANLNNFPGRSGSYSSNYPYFFEELTKGLFTERIVQAF